MRNIFVVHGTAACLTRGGDSWHRDIRQTDGIPWSDVVGLRHAGGFTVTGGRGSDLWITLPLEIPALVQRRGPARGLNLISCFVEFEGFDSSTVEVVALTLRSFLTVLPTTTRVEANRIVATPIDAAPVGAPIQIEIQLHVQDYVDSARITINGATAIFEDGPPPPRQSVTTLFYAPIGRAVFALDAITPGVFSNVTPIAIPMTFLPSMRVSFVAFSVGVGDLHVRVAPTEPGRYDPSSGTLALPVRASALGRSDVTEFSTAASVAVSLPPVQGDPARIVNEAGRPFVEGVGVIVSAGTLLGANWIMAIGGTFSPNPFDV